MARAPYRPVEETEALRPVAAPVDTFVAPQAPSRDTSLQDLARPLSTLGGNLGSFVEKRDKDAEEADKLRGEAAFHTSNQQGYAEGVSSGVIPAQASKTFVAAYKKAEGENAGSQLEQKFSAAYDAFEGKTSTDPKVYDQFVAGFLKDNIKTNDPEILAGLLPKVHQLTANYLQRHIGDTSKAVMADAVRQSGALNDQAIQDANSAGLARKEGTDYEGVFKTLEANRAKALSVGQNAEDHDKTVIDGVTSSSVNLRDPKILDFLKRKVPGKDYTWEATPYGRDAKQKAIDALETMGRKSIADDERARKEAKAAEKDEVTRTLIGAISKAPNAPLPEDLLARGEKVDPDFRVNAIRWRDTIGKGGQTSDNEAMLAVTTDILNGGGLRRVQRAIADGDFKNPEDMTKAFKLAESLSPKEGSGPGDVLKGASVKTVLDTIKRRTAIEKDTSKILFDDGSMSPEGLQAQTDFKIAMLQWRTANPNAGPIEQEKATQDIGAAYLKRIQQDEPMGPTGYNRDGLSGPNAFGSTSLPPKELPPEAANSAAPKAAPAPAQGIPPTGQYGEQTGSPLSEAPAGPAKALPPAATAPAPAKPTSPPSTAPDAASWYRELPEETQRALELRAAQQKKPLQQMMEEVYQRGVQGGAIVPSRVPGKQSMAAPDGTPIETASATTGTGADIERAFKIAQDAPPSPDTVRLIQEAFTRALAGKARPQGGYSSAVLRDDPKAARILDFVAGPESGGNYNAFYGNGRSTKDLSAMTLDEVARWSQSRGTASSATGRYQFMHDTLVGNARKGDGRLKAELGLTGTERFTPELQDRMALQFLNRRGYGEWQAGRITDAAFANRLALEWASLPNITAQNGRPAGVSAYADDGLNRSSVSAASVLSALTGRVGGMFRRKAGNERASDGQDL
ncbi:glycoside hydrolase family 104 protein [Methylobacterium sp. WL6]|uniref:glycoside hydrolase family 104 protein n=1 Tax=Methylobacterium sp. WL6 TaxID=2603901 RepID=UPI0011CAEB60|nr:glycoside hydrolase family 104 protein [Methylobacterium sp. WL6]TXN68125.1 glycoside hydrolase family 104 protein [Methylobacterium sp. WL6]